MKRKKIYVLVGILTAAILGSTALSGCDSMTSTDSCNAGDITAFYDEDCTTSYYEDYTGDDNSLESSGYDRDVSTESFEYDGDISTESLEYDGDISTESIADDSDISAKSAATDNTDTNYEETDASDAENSTDQKLIVTWNLSMETENYDEAISEIRESVTAAGGYIEQEDESSYYDYDRYLDLTIRIPEENASDWIESATSYGTILTRSQNTEDVSLTYVDTESRLEALRAEQESLMAMMDKAEEISDLITIQSELTNVNAEIESYESQLRFLDNRVNYTTIYLSINEVNRESVLPQTFGSEVKETFLSSICSLGKALRAIAIGLIGNSVVILVLIALITAIVLIIKKIRKRFGRTGKKRAEKSKVSTGSLESLVRVSDSSTRGEKSTADRDDFTTDATDSTTEEH